MPPETGITYSAIVVTFRRAASLRQVLRSLAGQTHPPSLTVVADNDPDRSAEQVVHSLLAEWPGSLVYTPVGANLGPAGGWAHAAAIAQDQQEHRGEWLLVLDDDDPLGSPKLAEAMLAGAAASGGNLAALGLRGAHWRPVRARLQRCNPPEGAKSSVDYLAGGGAPFYAWAAIDEVGFFHAPLFFGFEDLEMGLRLREAGWDVRVCPLPSLHEVADTATKRSAWREYYKTRALIWILGRHKGRYAVFVTVCRSVVLGGLRLMVIERQPALMRARFFGMVDALAGRLGARRYFPSENPPKPGLASTPELGATR